MTQSPLFPRTRITYPEGFERLWDLWRSDRHKKRAFERWAKLSRSDQLLLERRVGEYNGADFNRRELRYVPYLATFIRDEDWREPPQGVALNASTDIAEAIPRDGDLSWLEAWK